MGSGTTAAAALKHGRQYLGCELNNFYGPLQQERLKKLIEEINQTSTQPDLFGEIA
jgi:DNA modification methylase